MAHYGEVGDTGLAPSVCPINATLTGPAPAAAARVPLRVAGRGSLSILEPDGRALSKGWSPRRSLPEASASCLGFPDHGLEWGPGDGHCRRDATRDGQGDWQEARRQCPGRNVGAGPPVGGVGCSQGVGTGRTRGTGRAWS